VLVCAQCKLVTAFTLYFVLPAYASQRGYLYGRGRFKTPFGGGRITKLKSLDVRYGYYRQSTGLTAIISANLAFIMP
jgi:hypothetical protein